MVVVDLVWVGRHMMENALMATELQMVDGLKEIDRGKIKSARHIGIAKQQLSTEKFQKSKEESFNVGG